MDNKNKTWAIKREKIEIKTAYRLDAFYISAVYNKRLTLNKEQ